MFLSPPIAMKCFSQFSLGHVKSTSRPRLPGSPPDSAVWRYLTQPLVPMMEPLSLRIDGMPRWPVAHGEWQKVSFFRLLLGTIEAIRGHNRSQVLWATLQDWVLQADSPKGVHFLFPPNPRRAQRCPMTCGSRLVIVEGAAVANMLQHHKREMNQARGTTHKSKICS